VIAVGFPTEWLGLVLDRILRTAWTWLNSIYKLSTALLLSTRLFTCMCVFFFFLRNKLHVFQDNQLAFWLGGSAYLNF
jgi:hypothetical protein